MKFGYYTVEHNEVDGCHISYKKGDREWSSSFNLFECVGNSDVELSPDELRTGDYIILAYEEAGLY